MIHNCFYLMIHFSLHKSTLYGANWLTVLANWLTVLAVVNDVFSPNKMQIFMMP